VGVLRYDRVRPGGVRGELEPGPRGGRMAGLEEGAGGARRAGDPQDRPGGYV